ncbi:MAG: serine--tRNA ligase, partial [Candidatus Binatia bacterium]|nr:serine--tRNA ligase [Candidatus Binatia bacterium]
MLDVKLLRDDLPRVKERMATRGAEVDWDGFVSLDRERRDALANLERLKEKKNRLSGEIGKLKKSGGDATALMREVEEVSEAIRDGEGPLAEIEARFERFMLSLPNLPNIDVAIGKSAADNREIRRWGEPPQFDFPAKNHWEIGEELNILDFVRGAKL